MKKTIRETKMQLQLRDIIAKLDDLSALVRQQSELLRRPAPNEPEFRPSAYHASLSAESHDEPTSSAFGRASCANKPLRTPRAPRVDPNLGTL